MKVCPKCGSINIMSVIGGTIGLWKCKKCGFQGSIFPDIKKIKKEKK